MIRVAGVLVMLIAVVLGWGWWDYQHAADQALLITKPVRFEIKRGDSLRNVTQSLSEHGILHAPFWFKVRAVVEGTASHLRVGEYELIPGTTAKELLDMFSEGKVLHHTLTLVEGWTFQQVLAELARQPDIILTLAGKSDRQIMALISVPEECPEGLFFPDTYFFTKGTTDVAMLRRAYRKMQQVLDAQWANKSQGLPLSTPYDALILASIIEKETARAAERSRVAGVFTRRLKIGMRLQTDPTVIYGLGERFDGNLRRADLIENTPYNTYVHTGLPPTPIAMPGAASIHAALHPDKGDSLYFVSRGDGTHVFSASFKEHNPAVDRYPRKRNRK